jgi:hypothetical protein
MRWKPATGLIWAAGMLAGCTTLDDNNIFAMRYGPSPILARTVQDSAIDQAAVIQMVLVPPAVLAAGGPLPPPRVLPSYGDREGWFNVILAGFNNINESCDLYITDLWKLERIKTRNSTILHAAGAATAAILSAQVTPQTAAALLVISQAFGLAGVLNNAIADSYLYSQSAANVRALVKVTRDAYRDDLAKNFSPENKLLPPEVAYPMGSVPAAYFHMREYLSLCLPPAIQGQVDKLVAGAQAAPAGSPEEKKAKEQKAAGASSPVSAAFRRARSAPRTSPQITIY